jgi:hypothetical protein
MLFAYMHPDIEFLAIIIGGEGRQFWQNLTQAFRMGPTDNLCTEGHFGVLVCDGSDAVQVYYSITIVTL